MQRFVGIFIIEKGAFCVELLKQKNFGPNVIYFALGITDGRPAGAFWADKIVF